jgi:hypothetical protein
MLLEIINQGMITINIDHIGKDLDQGLILEIENIVRDQVQEMTRKVEGMIVTDVQDLRMGIGVEDLLAEIESIDVDSNIDK